MGVVVTRPGADSDAVRLDKPADWSTALRTMQTAAGIDGTALAAAVGVSRTHIANMRWGNYTPSFRIFLLIIDTLGYDLTLTRRKDT